jgi:DNA repair protein RecO (recombination protein O)
MRGVVLRHADYREHDRMLTLLTPDRGRVDLLSRGCRRPKSCLMTGSELFVHGEFVAFRSHDRYTLTSCAPEDTFYPLRLDAYRLTCATYLLNLAQAAAQPDQPAQGLYALLLKGLYHLAYCQNEAPLSVVNAFLLLYAAETGYRPRTNHCALCLKPLAPDADVRLDVSAGGLCCAACKRDGQYALSASQAAWMRAALEKGFDVPLNEADAGLFTALRAYMEGKLEMCFKCSQFLP